MIFSEQPEFKKEFKKLCKKHTSLKNDFETFKPVLKISPTGDILPNKHIVRIAWLWEKVNWEFFKIRRFFCKSLKSKRDLRIIYKYSSANNQIEFQSIEFIEIFHKNTKSNHSIERIEKYYS